MVFDYTVKIDGIKYLAGTDVPIDENGNLIESNKPIEKERSNEFVDYAYSGYIESMQENGYNVYPEGTGYIELYSKDRCKEIVDTAILHKADAFYGSLDHSILIDG